MSYELNMFFPKTKWTFQLIYIANIWEQVKIFWSIFIWFYIKKFSKKSLKLSPMNRVFALFYVIILKTIFFKKYNSLNSGISSVSISLITSKLNILCC